ncbi:MAG: hydrogen gas-evolving membrane-bound hydrogenase subunit E, partial [Dehalococcoidia bacterium]
GRLAAHVPSRDATEGRFGFLAVPDDPRVTDALVAAAVEWLDERGVRSMAGPYGWEPSEEMGVQVAGHEHAAATGRPYEVHLALWEGWNRILVASIVAIAAGFALVPLHRGLTRTPWLPVRSDAVTQGFLDGLSAFAGRASRTMQHGSTPLYIATVLVFTAAPLAVLGLISSPFDSIEARLEPIPLVASVIVVVGAIAAANSETRFRSIAALGATGFGMTLVFLQFGAPDVAMTQALVETLTVVLFIFAFRFLPVRPPRSPLSVRVGALVVAAVAGVATTAITLAASTAERPGRLRGFFEEASYLEAHGRNVVNTILVDFRALDTLGEITVLAAAALGILALLRITESRGRQGMNEVPMSRVLRTAARGLLPLIVMFAFFLFLRGHNEPGGGFVAGLVAAAAVTLYAIAYDTGTARAILRVPPQAFIAAGLLVAIGTAAATSLPGTAVLTGHWVQVSIPGSGTVELGSPVLFDVGVFLVVLGVASTLATALLEER